MGGQPHWLHSHILSERFHEWFSNDFYTKKYEHMGRKVFVIQVLPGRAN